MNAFFSFGWDQSSKDTSNNGSSDKHSDLNTKPATTTQAPSKNPFDESMEDGVSEEERTEEDKLIGEENDISNGSNPFGEDPLINDMERHWLELSDLVESSLTDPFALQEFKDHLKAIAETLDAEMKGCIGFGRTTECLEYFLSENMFEKIYLFSTRQRVYCSEVRLSLLNFSTSLLTCPGPPLFIHQQVLRPLTRLLRACEMAQDQWLDLSLVTLLQQICILIQENDSLVDLFFTVGNGQVPSKFLVFTLLVRYMHSLSEAGMRARDAMLLCLSIAGRSPHSSLCDYIITDTEFCQVLAAGLSGTYSQLPQVVRLCNEEWESPLVSLEQSVVEMKKFMQALSYCNSVLQMAPLLVSQVCERLIKKGFLHPVLGPALLQTSIDEAATATGYLTLFLLNISNVQLMRTFLQFILTVEYDEQLVLNRLIQNIASDSQQLSSITLELFNVLLDLNCEDVLLELVIKYLLPGKHVMASQIPTIATPDLYGVASRRFLSLVPSCCVKAERLLVDTLFTSPRSSRSSSPPLQLPSPFHDSSNPLNSTPPTSKTGRSRLGSTSSTCSTTSLTSSAVSSQHNHTHSIPNGDSTPPTVLPRQQSSLTELINSSIMLNVLSPDAAYQCYLSESRAAIEACARACKCWTSSYSSCVLEERDDSVSVLSDTGSQHGSTIESDSSPHFDLTFPVIPSPSRNGTDSAHPPEGVSPTVSPHLSPRVTRKSLRRRFDGETTRFGDCTGLFLKILMEKLSRLLQNPPIVNVLLLRTVTRLSQYPQPLLRSLLLNHQLVLKPGVPNLYTVLQDLKQIIERVDRDREGFDMRLARARKTMVYTAAVSNGEVESGVVRRVSLLMSSANEGHGSRCESRMSDEHDQGVTTKDDTPPLPRRRSKTEGSRGLERMRKRKRLKVTVNTVYAIIMYAELLKELSALSLEHSVVNPELLQLKELTDNEWH